MAAFLADAPGPVRPRLFRELLILELESHLDRGDRPDAVNYHRRFPEHRDAVDEVFALFGPAGNTPPHSHHCHGGDDASPGQAETVADLQEARLHAEISSEVYGVLGRPDTRCWANWAGAGWESSTWPAGSCSTASAP